ncbi:diguanylate cyclase domain-containing protein [Teichococcus wenyumeiae]|uniref:diguanylate cyclase domain-containing protein n=1 Tax=Teichococcus wenyumeiae TaxID=2478470 RepID=UPI001314D642|nr:GGDEF domain-containing protein [Pseudoroseomonas wenyumeiae]
MTEQVRVREELRHRAYHDPLTDLPNRAGFHEAVARGLVLLDLDDFKHVNEVCGHSVGDEVLRLGGDEFALLLPGKRGLAEAGPLRRRC